MQMYVIERNIPGVGSLSKDELKGASTTSNDALAKLDGRVKWLHSYVAGDKTFCIYESESEEAIHEHAKLSGFPANTVTPISKTISPKTAEG